MQLLAFLVNFGPQNVPLIQTSGNFLGWLHMVWCVTLVYQINVAPRLFILKKKYQLHALI